MNLTTTMCHSHLLWMLAQPEKFEQACNKYSATSPAYQIKGIAGYIETTVTFEISRLDIFTKLYNDYYSLDQNIRTDWYNKVKNWVKFR